MDPQQYNLHKAAYSVNELTDLGLGGRTSIYDAIKQKKLIATKNGKKTLFLAPHVARFIASLASSNGGHDAV